MLKNRNNTYFGSKMHFIRSLWTNDLDKQGFSMRIDNTITYSDLVIRINGEKYIRYQDHVTIGYESQGSYLQQLAGTPPSFIAANGFYQGNLIWRGVMGLQRVGDLAVLSFNSKSSR